MKCDGSTCSILQTNKKRSEKIMEDLISQTKMLLMIALDLTLESILVHQSKKGRKQTR